MEQDKLYVVHWKTSRGKSGYGEPISHQDAMDAAQEGNVAYPNDEYWIEEAE